MRDQKQYLHEVAITAIIVENGKYLITRRSSGKKRFPGKGIRSEWQRFQLTK